MRNDRNNDRDEESKSSSGSKYDKQAGTKGSGSPKYDKDLESRQDQANRDRQEQQGEDEEA